MMVLLISKNIHRISYFLGAWLLISIVNFIHPSSVIEYIFIPNYAGYFIAGCCFFLIRTQGLSLYMAVILAGSFMVGVMYDSLILIDKSVWYHLKFSLGALIVILSGFYCLFIFMISIKENWVDPSWAHLCVLGGAISYPLYLLHDAIGLSLMNALAPHLPAPSAFGVTVVSMILLAWLVHSWGERPLAKWLRGQLIAFEQRYGPAFRKFLRRCGAADGADPVTQ